MCCCSQHRAPHPRDGPWAWVVCFVSCLINVILFGLLNSFGVLLPVLSEHFNASRGSTAWVGSLAFGLSFLLGPLTAKIATRFGERTSGVCGGLLVAAALITSSYVEHMSILYFSYGFLFGFGNSCLINAKLIILRKYFKKKVAFAVGISTAGASLGILIIGPVLQVLVDSLGWRGALRAASGAMFLLSLLCLFFDPNIEKDEHENENNIHGTPTRTVCSHFTECGSICKSPRFRMGTISIFLTFFGLFVPMIHLVRFAKDVGIPSSKSSLLFVYIGICSTLSRVIVGKVIEKRLLTPLQSIQLCSLVIGVSLIVFTQAKNYAHFIIFSIFYGLGNGVFVSAQMIFFLTSFTDMNKTASSLGTAYTVIAIATFSGAPIAGFIADVFDSYIPAFFIFGGLVVLAGTLPFCLLLCSRETLEPEDRVETRLTLVGSRLANVESSLLNINSIY